MGWGGNLTQGYLGNRDLAVVMVQPKLAEVA